MLQDFAKAAGSFLTSLSDENYEALGRIITHQLVLTGTFPIQLAEVQVLHALFGQVSDDRLVNSFLQILPERERQILSKAMDGYTASDSR